MKKGIFFCLLVLVIISSTLFTACTGNQTTTSTSSTSAQITTATSTTIVQTTSTPAATTTQQANWWDKLGEPQYGGTITFSEVRMNLNCDTNTFMGSAWAYWFERLFGSDWVVDRNTYSFKSGYVPIEYVVGNLAESWEIPDTQNVIIHIRQGVHWQNKAPLNGREFTAYDVEYHYDRMMGTGNGFTAPVPLYAGFMGTWEKATATDKYTVNFKFKKAGAFNFYTITNPMAQNQFEAREAVEAEGGTLKDWTKAVGTGPWMITDYTPNISNTYVRNTDYWGHDERYPENQLPYADTLKVVIISDTTTAISALRTGKIDILTSLTWQQAETLTKNNTKLQQSIMPVPGPTVGYRVDKEPFNNINVRKALAMAINRSEIASSFYGGKISGTPTGLISSDLKDYCYSYTEWSQALKDEYSYNPTKAKQLLAEAGYSTGFKTYVNTSATDTSLLQAIKAYYLEIGVDMEIKTYDPIVYADMGRAGKHDAMIWNAGGTSGGGGGLTLNDLQNMTSTAIAANNSYQIKDTAYDKLVADLEKVTDLKAVGPFMQAADKYIIEQHWPTPLFDIVTFNVNQPYLKGYSGESIERWGLAAFWARLWIDQDLKKSMGN